MLTALPYTSKPYSNEFVRYHNKAEYKQLVSGDGEDLTHVATATMKKPCNTIRNGPTLSKVILCGHGGGRRRISLTLSRSIDHSVHSMHLFAALRGGPARCSWRWP